LLSDDRGALSRRARGDLLALSIGHIRALRADNARAAMMPLWRRGRRNPHPDFVANLPAESIEFRAVKQAAGGTFGFLHWSIIYANRPSEASQASAQRTLIVGGGTCRRRAFVT